MSSQVDHTLTSDDNINVPEVEEESLEEGTTSIEQNVSIIDHQDEFIEGEAVSGRSSSLEDPLVSEESNDDEEKGDSSVEAMVSPVHQHLKYSDDQEPQAEFIEGEAVSGRRSLEDPFISEYNNVVEEELSIVHQMSSISDEDSVKEDASNTVQVEDMLISGDSAGEEEEEQASSFSDDQEEENGREDAPDTSIYVEEESSKLNQQLEDNSLSCHTECLSEHNFDLASQNVEINPLPASSKKYLEVTTHQVRQGVDSSQVGDIALDIPDREDTVGQALEKDTNMENLDSPVISSEGMRSSRVATAGFYVQ
ncbi:hypothetical protein F7725_028171 [Dissostichus mawsoni]|uniref:Uncharacterized protein n=1 Tax=Dissostichus mawsoni TaxID=36200 RepID=A0A7J5XFM9_DISMA|nr:hypothetical protein F7725_028171 [Dissostichus mawsoni]